MKLKTPSTGFVALKMKKNDIYRVSPGTLLSVDLETPCIVAQGTYCLWTLKHPVWCPKEEKVHPVYLLASNYKVSQSFMDMIKVN